MSILGVVLRARPEHLPAVLAHISDQPGLDIALNPGDGRLVIILEDTEQRTASQSMAAMALLPGVINTSLVYEYSGADACIDGTDHGEAPQTTYQSWRTSLSDMAAGNQSN